MSDDHAHFHHTRSSDDDRSAVGRRITWTSVVVNIVLTAMQLVIGFIAHSQSLMADAMHTLADVVSDGFVLFAIRSGSKAADADHPYGHGRVETAASLMLGLVLFATGAGILLSAASRLQNLGNVPMVGVAAMWAAIVTLIGKELLFRYMLRAAQRLRSPMLVANAWHARADALSSLVVAAGVGGALAGFRFADALAAVVVGAMVIKSGLGFAWSAILELIDTSLSADEVDGIRASIRATPGVRGLHELRTRRMGHQSLVDAHIQVSPRISVSEGHHIAESARQRVLDHHPEVLDVMVHIDAENDFDPSLRGGKFPGREVLVGQLESMLGEDLAQFEKIVLHFLGQQVEAEVFLSVRMAHDLEYLGKLEARLAKCLPENEWFHSITLNHTIAPK
ncbi:cation diffusion facilitator family transporter [Georgfuchsia toluolica]|nr:cation diffusion facilitator family transporter [Georgfuchsia toluolica]